MPFIKLGKGNKDKDKKKIKDLIKKEEEALLYAAGVFQILNEKEIKNLREELRKNLILIPFLS
jgi:hypothetical protein